MRLADLFQHLLFPVPVLLQRLQGLLPLNPMHFSTGQAPSNATPMTPDLAFNTAVSFMTNTNWQSYSPDTTLSYFVQMAALDSSELRVGGGGNCGGGGSDSWFCAAHLQRRSEISGSM